MASNEWLQHESHALAHIADNALSIAANAIRDLNEALQNTRFGQCFGNKPAVSCTSHAGPPGAVSIRN
jgi:hypothetical protein